MPGAKKVVESIIDAVVDVVEAIIDAIGDILEFIWKDILMPVFEFIVGLFGIEDEDVISTQVLTQRVVQDDVKMSDLMTKIALEEQQAPVGIIDRLQAYSEITRKRYSGYFTYGDETFLDGLPEGNLRALAINEGVIKTTIDNIYGIDATLISTELGVVDKEAYVGFHLQESYGYTPYNNVLPYGGVDWSVSNIDYNYTTDVYDVYIRRQEDQTTTTTTTTTISVTDNVQGATALSKSAEAATTYVELTIDGSTHTIDVSEGAWAYSLAGYVDGSYLYTVVEYDVSGVVVTTYDDTVLVNNYEVKRTLVEERVVVVGSIQGEFSNVVTVLSDTSEDVLVGTTVESVEDVVSVVDEVDVTFATDILQVNSYEPVRYYKVVYYTVDAGEWLYWVYKAGAGTYPDVDNTSEYTKDLDMLPVITVRNSTISINEDKQSARYIQSKKMLNFLGIEIDSFTEGIEESPNIDTIEDTFIHFGLLPTDNSKVVSKVLFKTFDYVFYDSGLNQEGKYVTTMTEGSYNAAMSWSSQTRVVVDGIIGSRGHYEHAIVGKNLVMKWQAAEEQYVVLTITNLSSVTFIDRQGLVGCASKDVDRDGFYVPLSYFFVTQLSPLEQYELYNRSLLLSNYAADVQHLEWYETDGFMSFLQIIAVIITIVSFGSMAWVNGVGFTAAAVTQAAVNVAIGLAVSIGATMLLKLVMESTDSEFVRILAAVVYIVGMSYGAGMAMPTDASMLVQGVTMFATVVATASTAVSINTNIEMAKLQEEMGIFNTKLEQREEELDKAQEALDVGLSVEEITGIVSLELEPAYLYGVDAMMHRAVGMQYEFGTMYDYGPLVGDFYEKKKQLGVV